MIQHSEASERNKRPILCILTDVLAASRRVLEIGSGTGQHAVYFAAALPHLTWQPSERAEMLGDLRARVAAEGPPNCAEPLELDVGARLWPATVMHGRCDVVFSANTLHILAWSSVERLFDGIGQVLADGGRFCVYGPFRYNGSFTTPSNERFDRALRARDPLSGIRDFEAVNELARQQCLELQADRSMPANNQLLIWNRQAPGMENSNRN